MKIEQFKLGMMPTNSYLLWENSSAILFDCGGEDLDDLVKFINDKKLILHKVVFTHGHFDHIGGILKLKQIFPEIEIYIGEEEKEFFNNTKLNLSHYLTGKNYRYEDNYKTVRGGEYIDNFLVIDTPGHTVGGKSYFHEKSGIAIVGDTMFKGSYGRYDLPTSDGQMLFNSLKKLCDTLPPETKVYSGHTDVTTIKDEYKNLKESKII